jgi:hypothetical protein
MYGELCSYEPDSNDAVDSVVCKMKLASPAGFLLSSRQNGFGLRRYLPAMAS